MADAKWDHTNAMLLEASDYMAKQARIELGAKRPRTAIRASWRKSGRNWVPSKVRKKTIRKNFEASGDLVRSVTGLREEGVLGIEFLQYGEYVISGRKKGKWVPRDAMRDWIQNRKLRPRDPETGEFVKNTKQARRAMAFMMNRKIKYFGIEPFDFAGIARTTTLEQYDSKIQEAISKDIINQINNGSSI